MLIMDICTAAMTFWRLLALNVVCEQGFVVNCILEYFVS